jgi:hypothetical protein
LDRVTVNRLLTSAFLAKHISATGDDFLPLPLARRKTRLIRLLWSRPLGIELVENTRGWRGEKF